MARIRVSDGNQNRRGGSARIQSAEVEVRLKELESQSSSLKEWQGVNQLSADCKDWVRPIETFCLGWLSMADRLREVNGLGVGPKPSARIVDEVINGVGIKFGAIMSWYGGVEEMGELVEADNITVQKRAKGIGGRARFQ